MPAKTKTAHIESKLDAAEKAMKSSSWFLAEREALAALDAAISAGIHDLAADATLPLQEARRQRTILAIDASDGVPKIVEAVEQELETVEPGVHLLVPHAVAADARRMRVAAQQTEVPLLAVCREPDTRMGEVPIVAIGEVTVRAYVAPPENPEAPGLDWVLAAHDALGDAAIARIDPAIDGTQKIEALRNALESVPEHERLHQALAAALREAAG
ncbi:MAG: hypothetical protein VX726_05660 [Planctomycetota bacterium]|nr:hypothetical protein [Planctomycetota bacterium]